EDVFAADTFTKPGRLREERPHPAGECGRPLVFEGVDDSIERGLECGPSEQEPPRPVRRADSLGQGRRVIAVETVKAQGDSRPPDPSVARRAHLTIARR